MQVWVGTSGYSYPDWVGGFYPAGTGSGRMLSYYCGQFPLVELNFTFYRMPTAAMLARLAEQTPEGFQFIVKLPRSLSHEENPADIEVFRQSVDVMKQQGKLLGLLCQMPQATHRERQHEAWLETLAQALRGYALAVEFRHRSWFDASVALWLAAQSLDLVAVDVPDLPGLYPGGLVQSGRTIYVRFHSRNEQNWYRSDKDRYDYNYEDRALEEWIDVLRSNRNPADRVMLLFNNCQRSQAAANARRMRELLSKMAPEMQVVEPFAATEPRQRLLFE